MASRENMVNNKIPIHEALKLMEMLSTVTPLKKARFEASLTQVELARKAGMSQSTFQRYETGFPNEIPEDALKRLAKVLKCSPEQLSGELDRNPREATEVAATVSEYFGEIAVHFTGASRPFLAPISEYEYEQICERTQIPLGHDYGMLSFRTLDNRYVLLRRASVAEIYLSSEGSITYGPPGSELKDYPDYIGAESDTRFWNIASEIDHVDDEELHQYFGKEIVDEVIEALDPPDGETPDQTDLRKHRALIIAERANSVICQFSNGVRRSISDYADEDLWKAFNTFFPDLLEVGAVITLTTNGGEQDLLINPDAIDFLSVPAEKLDRIALELLDDERNQEAEKATKAAKRPMKEPKL